MDPHPALSSLAFLLGTWRGRGEGSYPTIDDFAYTEEVVFGHVGKPFISYRQGTKSVPDGLPLHAESGYLRPVGAGGVELVLSQPSGFVEVHEGTVTATTVTLHSTLVVATPTAKDVMAVERWLSVEGDDLHYRVAMAAVSQPMTHHLEARLRRVTDGA